MRLAVIGANGFVGTRIVEWFHLSGKATVVPIVRGVASLARLARYDLDWRLADGCSVDALAAALRGTDSAVHAINGNPDVIEAAAAALLPAAARAGVRRIVYLSTASVHGQNPAPGTSEDSNLSDRQAVGYNNAKVRAENILFRDSARHPVELIILRPSIIFGPRDRWVTALIGELQDGVAWLVGDGKGICNTLYVDNLIHAISLALAAPQTAAGKAYLLGDAEVVTWATFYRSVADALGFDFENVHRIDAPLTAKRNISQRLSSLKATKGIQAILPWIPGGLKRGANGFLAECRPRITESAWQLPAPPRPSPTDEMINLQRCQYRLPQDRAATTLAYSAPISFLEGVSRTIAWWRWCKY